MNSRLRCRRRTCISLGLVLTVLASALVAEVKINDVARATDGCTSGSVTTSTKTGRTFVANGYDRPYAAIQSDTALHQFTVVNFVSDGVNDARCTWTAPKGIKGTQLVVVGGGGAGGTHAGGGGGGGGVYINKVRPITANVTYDITVGTGGLAKEQSCDTDCNGADGRPSVVAQNGDEVASASGGGGGGGNGKSAVAPSCVQSACGGGGGGAAGPRNASVTTSGATGAFGSVSFGGYAQGGPAYNTSGGSGSSGGSSGGTNTAGANRFSGGGGGGGLTSAGDFRYGRGFKGASGVYPLLTWGIDTNVRTYGGGGGGFTSTVWSVDRFSAYSHCSLEYDSIEDQAPSRLSGGCGGVPSSPARHGVNDFGGGGGGGSVESIETIWNTLTTKGGNGGAGIVSIAYFQKPVVAGGVSSIVRPFGSSSTTQSFTASGGNSSLADATLPGSVFLYSWSVNDTTGNAVPGITINSNGVVTVGASVAVGTYAMEVRATDGVGSYGTTPLTVTISKGVQSPLTFTSTAPADRHVGGDPYIVTVGGGSGSGDLTISIDSTSSNVCQINGTTSGSEVSFQQTGNCLINGNKAGDSIYLSASQVQQTVIVTPRSSQAALNFTNSFPAQISNGTTLDVSYTGGSGTSNYSLAVASYATSFCSLAGTTVTALSLGRCVLTLNRAGDYEYEAASEVTVGFQIVAGRTISLSQPTQRVYTYSGSTVAVGVFASVSEGMPISVWFRTTPDSTNCSFGHPGRYDLGFTGVGICKIYVEENDNAYSYTRSADETFYVIAPGDVTAATVSEVTAPGFSGSFSSGQDVYIKVKFSERVVVSGTPRLLLETGTTDRYATYVSGSYEDTLVFKYTMQSGDSSEDLDYKATSSLESNGGSIQDLSTNNATLTLGSPGSSGSLGANSSIVIGTPAAATTTSTSSTTSTTSTTTTSTTTAPTVELPNPVVALLAASQSGFTFSISGYDPDLTYGLSATHGSVSWANQAIGLVRVTGLSIGQSSNVTVTVSCASCNSASQEVTGSALGAARTPSFGVPTAQSGGFEVEITNHSEDWVYRVASGNATISNGVVTAFGLGISQSATITVESSRFGYQPSSASIAGSSNSTPTTTMPTNITPTTTTTAPATTTTMTAVVPPAVGTSTTTVPATSTTTQSLALRVSKAVTAAMIAKSFRVTIPAKSTLSLVVSSQSKSVCKVVGKSLRGTKLGMCKLTITVISKKGRKTSKTVTIAVRK